LIPVAGNNRVHLAHYGVLEEGMLAGADNNRRYEQGVAAQPWPKAARRSLAERLSVALQLSEVAAEFQMTLPELAVGFAVRPYEVDGIQRSPSLVLGVGKPGQLEPLLAGLDCDLPVELVAAVDDLVPPGTAVGTPDRSRLRAAALRRAAIDVTPLVSGDPRQ
jgi:aryl-alcohol dehydrogenase-like predicted oxidoreductase